MLNIKNIFLIDFYSYFLNNNLFYSLKKKNLTAVGKKISFFFLQPEKAVGCVLKISFSTFSGCGQGGEVPSPPANCKGARKGKGGRNFPPSSYSPGFFNPFGLLCCKVARFRGQGQAMQPQLLRPFGLLLRKKFSNCLKKPPRGYSPGPRFFFYCFAASF